MKAEVLLFSNFTSGGHQGGHPFQNFGFERHHDFEKKSKIFKISNQNRLFRVRPGVRPMSDLKRATSQLSLEKKIIS